MLSWDEIEHLRQLEKEQKGREVKRIEKKFVVYLTAKQLDDILSNRVSKMVPVIEHIRNTVQEA